MWVTFDPGDMRDLMLKAACHFQPATLKFQRIDNFFKLINLSQFSWMDRERPVRNLVQSIAAHFVEQECHSSEDLGNEASLQQMTMEECHQVGTT